MPLPRPLRRVLSRLDGLRTRSALRSGRARVRVLASAPLALRYSYRPDRYRQEHMEPGRGGSATFPVDHLLLAPPRELPGGPAPAPRVLFLFWTGDNPVTSNRRASLEFLREKNPGLDIVLVTPENLPRYIKEGHPLHRSYGNLSTVHRSDYLRAYFMHHWGGAYCDIKKVHGDFGGLIDSLNADPELWATGMPEGSPDRVGEASGRLGQDQRHYFGSTLAQNCFAYRPGTPLTEEWLAETERRLDYFGSLLERRPAQDPFGQTGDYPVPWYALLVSVVNPLNLKYLNHVRPDPSFRFLGTGEIENYR